MKKLLYFFSAVVIMALASCSSNADYEQIDQKLANGDELTQADYSKMIDYVEAPLLETIALFKQATPDNLEELAKKGEEIKAKYPYADAFATALQQNTEKFDDENLKKFDALKEKITNL